MPLPSSSTCSNLLPEHFSQKRTVSSIRCPHLVHLCTRILRLFAVSINFWRVFSCDINSPLFLFSVYFFEYVDCCAGASSTKVVGEPNLGIWHCPLSRLTSKLLVHFNYLTDASSTYRVAL